ncbi:MAG: hypothetical protein ABWZ25_10045 [Chitinophagaceae bacterium]
MNERARTRGKKQKIEETAALILTKPNELADELFCGLSHLIIRGEPTK